MDSVGIGELPDASAYGDQGSNTLGNICRQVGLQIPTLRGLGLDRLGCLLPGQTRVRPRSDPGQTAGAFGKMAEASAGKDSVTGHWEMMGIVLDQPFPVFTHGFDAAILDEFSRRTGRG